MSADGEINQPHRDASTTEAFRELADIYVEVAAELLADDPDLCLDAPRLPQQTLG